MTDKYRLIQKRDAQGEYWFTERNKAGATLWLLVHGTLSYDRRIADIEYDACVAGKRTDDGIVVRHSDEPKRKDKNPLREVVKTIELDCVVSYRVEEGIDDELPNCYDIEVKIAPGALDVRHPGMLKWLEAELSTAEQERLDTEFRERAEDRYLERPWTAARSGGGAKEARGERLMEMLEQRADAMKENAE
jgi:hypothetical protein